VSTPPPLIRPEAVARMGAAADRLLAPQFRAVIGMIDEPILQPIYDLETPRMAFGRVAIVGDAAFVARPHVAAGVAKAADDAAAPGGAPAHHEVAAALRRARAGRGPVGRPRLGRVVVTGSSGLIGRAVLPGLAAAGARPVRFDIRDGDAAGRADLRDAGALRRALAEADGVVHLAAVSRVVSGEREPDVCWAVN